MANSDYKEHIAPVERARWEKVIVDFANHLGSGGADNHRIANGSVPGFTTNDFTTAQKNKLTGIQDGALNNPHPATHPHTMITGLHQVSVTGNYQHLNNIPLTFVAGGGNSDTVGGIRIWINYSPPPAPRENQELWINLNDNAIYTYRSGAWMPTRAAFSA